MTLEVKPSNTVPEVRTMVMDWSGEPSIQQRLIFNGGRLESDQTLAEVGIKAGSTIFLVLSLRKPVIYLFSPTTLNAVIDLSLLPGLKFSALYPVVPIKEQGETSNGCKVVSQCVSWKVQVLPDGTLLDKDSGSLVSYLYWEAT